MKQRVVIDTNVLISSNIKLNSNPANVMKLFYLDKLQLFYSPEILSEYKKVLAYKKFNFDVKTQTDVVSAILVL